MKFDVIIEDADFKQHKETFEADSKEEAELFALNHFAATLKVDIESLTALVAVEVIADKPLNGFVWIKDLKKGESFEFNGKVHVVKTKWRNDEDKPLVTEEGELFHWEELNVILK